MDADAEIGESSIYHPEGDVLPANREEIGEEADDLIEQQSNCIQKFHARGEPVCEGDRRCEQRLDRLVSRPCYN